MAKNRQHNLDQANEEAVLVEDMGHSIVRFTDFHWRIDDKIDVWPSTKKWMKRDGFYNVKIYLNLWDVLK